MGLVRKTSLQEMALGITKHPLPEEALANLPPDLVTSLLAAAQRRPPGTAAEVSPSEVPHPDEAEEPSAGPARIGRRTGYAAADRVHLPMHFLPRHGLGSDAAYDLISSDLLLDGSAKLNLATFVTTSMPDNACRLMAQTADKNMIDKDEYPQTAEIEARCVNIIANLWHATQEETATGCSTTGSSEAVMLGALALKWRWRERQRAAGRPTDRPNLVTGANVQVCWEKFCRYWDVEARLVPVEGDRLHLTGPEAVKHCDENTIGVAAVLGSTFDGSYEPVKEIAAALDQLQADTGLDIPIHVDAASGGFVAPFLQPELEWDFRIPRVQSINSSGHKYGLVFPGVGWAIWRDAGALPRDLIFDVNYLGGHMPTFSLNFSRPGSEVIAQYYMFTSLGVEGYRMVQQRSSDIARYLAHEISEMGPYRLISDGSDLPVFAFALKPEVTKYTVFEVSDRLRQRGWQVPAYTFPENRQDLAVMRIVVRSGMSYDMADHLLADLRSHTEKLEGLEIPVPPTVQGTRQAFAH
jgi:glutamate decarboxylase